MNSSTSSSKTGLLKALAGATTFAVCVTVCHVSLSRAALSYVASYDRDFQLERDFREQEVDVDVLILGDSRPGRDLMPSLIGQAYCLWSPGETYDKTYHRLLDLLREGHGHFSVVVLPLDQHSFSGAFRGEAETWFWGTHMDYLALGWERREPLTGLKKSVRYEWMPYVGLANWWALQSRTKVPPRIERGYFADAIADRSLAEQTPAMIARAAEMKAEQLYGNEWFDEDIADCFRKTLVLCRENDLQIVLVRFPLCSGLYRLALMKTPLAAFEERTRPLYEDIAGVTVLDYLAFGLGRDDLFSDVDHLNRKGAETLSVALKADLADALLGQVERADSGP